MTNDKRCIQSAMAGRTLRTYVVSEIESTSVELSIGRNRIELLRKDGMRHCYRIMFRHRTDEYRKSLRYLYPSLYREYGLPNTVWGRILKY